MGTSDLRRHYLLDNLFVPGEMRLAYCGFDRLIIGGVVPRPEIRVSASGSVETSFFNERRETGVINIGGPGIVTVGREAFQLDRLECLYIGATTETIAFQNTNGSEAEFYLLSCPAHRAFPTRSVSRNEAFASQVGNPLKGSSRKITRYIHEAGVESCQLVMGFTALDEGSLWNTWPPHTHLRRSEVYLYFDLGSDTVLHLLGESSCTRHVVVRDRQAVLAPPWSIHCGVGTGNYKFVWGMAGENRMFEDMDPMSLHEFR